jgi:hypothetical protein
MNEKNPMYYILKRERRKSIGNHERGMIMAEKPQRKAENVRSPSPAFQEREGKLKMPSQGKTEALATDCQF